MPSLNRMARPRPGSRSGFLELLVPLNTVDRSHSGGDSVTFDVASDAFKRIRASIAVLVSIAGLGHKCDFAKEAKMHLDAVKRMHMWCTEGNPECNPPLSVTVWIFLSDFSGSALNFALGDGNVDRDTCKSRQPPCNF